MLRIRPQSFGGFFYSPMNWCVAAMLAVTAAVSSWLTGFTPVGVAFAAIVGFVGSLLWLALDDRTEAWIAQRSAGGSTDGLASAYAWQLRRSGGQGAVLGFGVLFLLYVAFQMKWAPASVVGVALVSTGWTIRRYWREIQDGCGVALRRAWTWYVAVMTVIGALTAHGCYEAAMFVRRFGKTWPKAVAFGIDPRILASCAACLAIVGFVWLANRWLAASIAADAGAEDRG